MAFVADHSDGFETLEALWRKLPSARLVAVSSITEASLRQLTEWGVVAASVLSRGPIGVNQSREGVATVSGICNLPLVSGQPNAMGGSNSGQSGLVVAVSIGFNRRVCLPP